MPILPDSIRAVHQFKILNEDIYVFHSDSENSDLYFYSKSKNAIVLSISIMPNFLTFTPLSMPEHHPFITTKIR